MANLRISSQVEADGVILGSGGGSSNVPMGEFFRQEKQIYPAANGTVGPMLSDGGLASGDLPSGSQTGKRFVSVFDTNPVTGQPYFNFQGMVPTQAPAGIQSAAGKDVLLNANTPRWNLGATGQYLNGNQDLRIGIASTTVVPVFWCGQGQLSATTLDMHVMVSDNGVNKHLSSTGTAQDGQPAVVTGGSGYYRRELSYIRTDYREHRFIMGANCYFLGVWVDYEAIVRRPDNKPLSFIHGLDSWNDPQSWWTQGQADWTGDFQCLPMCTVASFHTGMCHGTDAQGGTGEYNPNGTSGGDAASYSGSRSSAAWSDSRVNWRANWWSSQFPTFADIGGWNDGSSLVSPYRTTYAARVAARYTKTIAAISNVNNDARYVNISIEPVNFSTPYSTDPKYVAALGQGDVPALFPGFVLGAVTLMPMWYNDMSINGRDVYTLTADSARIHLRRIGDDAVSGYIWDRVKHMPIDSAFVAKTSSADIPIVTVPTS